MTEEQVVLVDKDNNTIGTAEKMHAHQLGLLHRAFSVFVFNQHGELLLQQRQQDKYHCGGLWTNTCCSHPRLHESVVAAGERRLQEEMGFCTDLQLLGTFTYRAKFANALIEHEYDHVLVGKYAGEKIQCDPNEVQAYKWISLEDLTLDLQQNPHLYTPWLDLALNIVQDNWDKVA